MTKLTAILGQVGLKTLGSANQHLLFYYDVLANSLDGSSLSVVNVPEGVKAFYYSNLLDSDQHLHMQDELCVLANSEGIRIKRTWQ